MENKYKNHMEIIAALLGVRLGEPFYLVSGNGEKSIHHYELTDHGMYRVGIRHIAEDNALVNLLTGYETLQAVAAPSTFGFTIKAQGTGVKNEEPMQGGLLFEDFYGKTVPSPGPSVLTPEQAELYVSMGGPYDKLCTQEIKEHMNKAIELVKENVASFVGKRALSHPIDEKAIMEEEPETLSTAVCPVCSSHFTVKKLDQYDEEYLYCATCEAEWVLPKMYLTCPDCESDNIYEYYDSGHMILVCEECDNEWDKTLNDTKPVKGRSFDGRATVLVSNVYHEPSSVTTIQIPHCPKCSSPDIRYVSYANDYQHLKCSTCFHSWSKLI